jgi:uracil phosphoribosyltransferase
VIGLAVATLLTLSDATRGPLSFGKILIQRNEETSQPKHIYSKFPPNLAQKSKSLPLSPDFLTLTSCSRRHPGANGRNRRIGLDGC